MSKFGCAWIFPVVLLSGCDKPPEIVYTSDDCGSCHQIQQADWARSDHAHAMAAATPETVKGNFGTSQSPTSVHHMELAAEFVRDDATGKPEYDVRLRRGAQVEQYKVAYTFGFYPLQQYLIEFERGKYQVFPFAWDDRPQRDGGQRWITLYPEEDIQPEDRLHWQQPLQNWNGMCADCHSDGLKRNYDWKKDSFSTTFQSIDVACLSCHDDMSRPHQHPTSTTGVASGTWYRAPQAATATWQGTARNNRFMGTCFACHSLRSALTDGFVSTQPFLDQFKPDLLQPPLYYPDGQIREEVYVYGSFLQSRMYSRGVNCADCHNPHSLELKVQGNDLCTQCHAPSVFDTARHHGHTADGNGSRCISCHMPQRYFMVVDERADHRFNVPRPDWTARYGVPNACNGCHSDKSPEWAADAWTRWNGAFKLRAGEEAYLQLMSGEPVSLESHWRVIHDETLPVIKRASALALLADRSDNTSQAPLSVYLTHREPLLRYAAVLATAHFDNQRKVELLSPLLSDPVAAVRLEAVTQLLGAKIPENQQPQFNQGVARIFEINTQAGWRAEGSLNNGVFALKMGRLADAEMYYRRAIAVDPYSPTPYINLADLNRAEGKPAKEQEIYHEALEKMPNVAVLHYAYGLFLVRQSNHELAETELAKAHELELADNQFMIAYVLILERNGKLKQAMGLLKTAIGSTGQNQSLLPLYKQLQAKCGQNIDCE